MIPSVSKEQPMRQQITLRTEQFTRLRGASVCLLSCLFACNSGKPQPAKPPSTETGDAGGGFSEQPSSVQDAGREALVMDARSNSQEELDAGTVSDAAPLSHNTDAGGSPPNQDDPCPITDISLADIDSTVRAMLLGTSVEERPFTRYLVRSHQTNAGRCGQQLLPRGLALTKALNSVSLNDRIVAALLRSADVYSIDIRDYQWDRPMVVDGEAFEDGWQAIVGSSPFAVELNLDTEDSTAGLAGTTVPWMYADALVNAVNQGQLYYALTGIDTASRLDEVRRIQFGIDTLANLETRAVIRAATLGDGPRPVDVLTERHLITQYPGAFWQTFRFEVGLSPGLFDDPRILFGEGGTEVVYALPNSLYAFLIADGNGSLVTQTSDARSFPWLVESFAAGIPPVVDVMRALADPFTLQADNPAEGIFELYPPQATFATIAANDTAIYLGKLGSFGISSDQVDPVLEALDDFAQPLALANVAGSLGLTSEVFSLNIERFSTNLQQLANPDAVIAREDFAEIFQASVCVAQLISPEALSIQGCVPPVP